MINPLRKEQFTDEQWQDNLSIARYFIEKYELGLDADFGFYDSNIVNIETGWVRTVQESAYSIWCHSVTRDIFVFKPQSFAIKFKLSEKTKKRIK